MKLNKIFSVLFLLSLGLFFIGCNEPDDDPDDDPIVPDLTITTLSVTLKVAETHQIAASITNGVPKTTYNALFVSGNEAVATVSATGLVTAVAVGQTTITVSISEHPTVIQTVSLTVEAADDPDPDPDPDPVEPLTLTGPDTVFVGSSITLVGDDADNTAHVVYWESNNTAILRVDQNGVVRGMSAGTAKIIISSFITGKSIEKEITAVIPETTGIEIAPLTITNITLSTSFKINATILPIGATGEIIWESSDVNIATIDASGTVDPTGPGEVTMKATVNNTSFSAEITFSVTPTPVEIFDLFNVEDPLVKTVRVFGYENAGASSYDYAMRTSVNLYLSEPLTIIEAPIPFRDPVENRPGFIKTQTDYITIHDTAAAAAGGNASAHSTYVTNGGGGTSWHYTCGTDGIYHHLPNNEVAWHAGDGSNLSDMTQAANDSLILATSQTPIVSITPDGYYSLNGTKSAILAPTDSGRILTAAEITSSGVNVEIGENGNWWIGNTYFNNSYHVIANGGGNRNSIGIESCINVGSDVFLCWAKLAKLVAFLLEEQGLDITAVVQHNFFSGKDCPMTMRHAEMWQYFVSMVRAEYLVRTYLKDYNIQFISSDPALVSNNGRVINLPNVATRVAYTVRITNNSGYDSQKIYYVDLPAKTV